MSTGDVDPDASWGAQIGEQLQQAMQNAEYGDPPANSEAKNAKRPRHFMPSEVHAGEESPGVESEDDSVPLPVKKRILSSKKEKEESDGDVVKKTKHRFRWNPENEWRRDLYPDQVISNPKEDPANDFMMKWYNDHIEQHQDVDVRKEWIAVRQLWYEHNQNVLALPAEQRKPDDWPEERRVCYIQTLLNTSRRTRDRLTEFVLWEPYKTGFVAGRRECFSGPGVNAQEVSSRTRNHSADRQIKYFMDGAHRGTTLFDFLGDKFSIQFVDKHDPTHVEWKRFSELPDALVAHLLNFQIPILVLCTDDRAFVNHVGMERNIATPHKPGDCARFCMQYGTQRAKAVLRLATYFPSWNWGKFSSGLHHLTRIGKWIFSHPTDIATKRMDGTNFHPVMKDHERIRFYNNPEEDSNIDMELNNLFCTMKEYFQMIYTNTSSHPHKTTEGKLVDAFGPPEVEAVQQAFLNTNAIGLQLRNSKTNRSGFVVLNQFAGYYHAVAVICICTSYIHNKVNKNPTILNLDFVREVAKLVVATKLGDENTVRRLGVVVYDRVRKTGSYKYSVQGSGPSSSAPASKVDEAKVEEEGDEYEQIRAAVDSFTQQNQ